MGYFVIDGLLPLIFLSVLGLFLHDSNLTLSDLTDCTQVFLLLLTYEDLNALPLPPLAWHSAATGCGV